MKRMTTLLLALTMSITTAAVTAAELTDQMKADGWAAIFDGQSLEGWKTNERADGFEVKEGAIVATGNRNHLYFMEELENFELMIDVKINKGGNAGVYVKSQWQENDWPTTGFELQVNSSHSDPAKTGTLYEIVKIYKAPHADDEWFTYHIKCQRNAIDVSVNGEILYTYVQPGNTRARRGQSQDDVSPQPITPQNKRINQKGHIALQQHDPGSTPQFKNIFLKKLPSSPSRR